MVNGIGHGQVFQPAFARFNGGVQGPDGGGKHEWKAEGHRGPGHHHGHDGRAHGAMRNLQAGHYQGMARLRLSINFSAEIRTQAAEAEGNATSEAAASFKEQATGIIKDFVDGIQEGEFDLEAVDKATEQFFAAVDQVGEKATTLDELRSGLREAVDAFGSALNDALTVEEPAETTDGTGGVEGPEDPEATEVSGLADVPPPPPAPGELTGTDPVETTDGPLAVGDATEVSAPEDPFARLTKLIEDLASSLVELAQSILGDAGANLDSFNFSFEASLVTVTSSQASMTYSRVSLSLEASSGDSSGLELAA